MSLAAGPRIKGKDRGAAGNSLSKYLIINSAPFRLHLYVAFFNGAPVMVTQHRHYSLFRSFSSRLCQSMSKYGA